MSPPTIVHVPRRLTASSWGGTETAITAIAELQRAAGWDARVCTTTALDEQRHESWHGVPVARFPYFYPEWPLPAARKAAYDTVGGNLVSFPLAHHLRALPQLDLVHLHTGNRLGAHLLRIARARGARCVLTLHGGYFTVPKQLLSPVTDAPLGWQWGRILSWWWNTRQLLASVDAVIAVGSHEHAALQQKLPNQRSVWIPGGVDTERFAAGDRRRGRQLIGADPQRTLMVCPGRLDAIKDQIFLVEAWNRAAKPIDLALVGPETTAGYANRCRTAANGSQGALFIPGAVTPADMPDILAAADLVVLPSQHEAFGLVIVEAWAAGRPVLVSAVGGPGELIAAHGGGIALPPGDLAAWASALSELPLQPERLAAFASAGKAAAHREFGWDRIAQRLATLYREIGVDC